MGKTISLGKGIPMYKKEQAICFIASHTQATYIEARKLLQTTGYDKVKPLYRLIKDLAGKKDWYKDAKRIGRMGQITKYLGVKNFVG